MENDNAHDIILYRIIKHKRKANRENRNNKHKNSYCLQYTEKRHLRIGIARYNPKLCVAYLNGQDCGACAEHCPVGALTMEPYKNTTIPKVNENFCIGCGACQYICPIQPVKAIVVEGVANQQRVEESKQEKEIRLSAEEDFPF